MGTMLERDKPRKKYKLYLFEWVDAESDVSWDTASAVNEWAEEDCLIREIGWLVRRTKKHIIVGSQIGQNGDIGNKTKIPRVYLRSMKRINLDTSTLTEELHGKRQD